MYKAITLFFSTTTVVRHIKSSGYIIIFGKVFTNFLGNTLHPAVFYFFISNKRLVFYMLYHIIWLNIQVYLFSIHLNTYFIQMAPSYGIHDQRPWWLVHSQNIYVYSWHLLHGCALEHSYPIGLLPYTQNRLRDPPALGMPGTFSLQTSSKGSR